MGGSVVVKSVEVTGGCSLASAEPGGGQVTLLVNSPLTCDPCISTVLTLLSIICWRKNEYGTSMVGFSMPARILGARLRNQPKSTNSQSRIAQFGTRKRGGIGGLTAASARPA